MINELEDLIDDLYDARSNFSRAVGRVEDNLTPEGIHVFKETMHGLNRLIDDVEIARMGAGD